MRCDFCSAPSPAWRYPAKTFHLPTGPVVQQSVGDWAACAVCHDLIENALWKALAERSFQTLLEDLPLPRSVHDDYRGELIQLHQRFAVARTGPAERI